MPGGCLRIMSSNKSSFVVRAISHTRCDNHYLQTPTRASKSYAHVSIRLWDELKYKTVYSNLMLLQLASFWASQYFLKLGENISAIATNYNRRFSQFTVNFFRDLQTSSDVYSSWHSPTGINSFERNFAALMNIWLPISVQEASECSTTIWFDAIVEWERLALCSAQWANVMLEFSFAFIQKFCTKSAAAKIVGTVNYVKAAMWWWVQFNQIATYTLMILCECKPATETSQTRRHRHPRFVVAPSA